MQLYPNYFEVGSSIDGKAAQDEYYGAVCRFIYWGEEPMFKSRWAATAFQGVRPSLEKQWAKRKAGIASANARTNDQHTDQQTHNTATNRQPTEASTNDATERATDDATEDEQGKKVLRGEGIKVTSNVKPPKPPYGEIVGYLNEKTGKSFKSSSKHTQSLINARWKEGFTLDDFKAVIDRKASQWLKDPKMADYLRPETIFSTKFESYLNEKGVMLDEDAQEFADLF